MSMNSVSNPHCQTGIKPPTYHRQRLLLFLLEQAGGTLSRLDLQKLLFLYVEDSGTRHYAFVPYRFGYYSFLAADDLELLHKRDWLTLSDKEISLNCSLRGQGWAINSEERQTVRRWITNNSKPGITARLFSSSFGANESRRRRSVLSISVI